MNFGQRQQQQRNISVFALVSMIAFALDAITSGTSASFPAFFSRPRLFQRPQQMQAQQQPPQQQVQQSQPQAQQEQLILAANSLIPAFGAFGLQQSDLMRLSSQQANLQHEHQSGSPFMTPPNHFDSVNYRPNGAQLLERQQPMQPSQQQQFNSALLHQIAATSYHEPQSLRMEPSQSEVVDKIERHIGEQIEQSLRAGNNHQALVEQHLGHKVAQASVYQNQAEPSGASEQRTGGREEKETSASGEEAEGEQAAAEEQAGGSAEKRSHHEEHKEQPEEHHHEHPPEAFEVHHKKGGKSFQYFHQGHHHHHP